ncbi:MAG: SDR family oxidoreductase [Anaerolineales bacterium]|jgi:3-oxoacyl-[acyl-carrier protein] reductase|nr:SDR family oxidoreductase [Anaerolineales bacterium]
MDLGLAGKRALVTGASRGLGYATAKALAAEGARVAINSRGVEQLQAAAQGLGAVAIPADITEPGAAERVIAETVASLGGLDILITNAGGPPSGSFESFDDAAWAKAIDLSLMSHVRLIRAALPHLRRSDAAAVLTITSYSVKQPIPNLVLSNSIRAATVGLTKTLALELGRDGIRFNSILPGWTETERVTELMTFRTRQNGTTLEQEIARQMAESPLGRMARPDEFAKPAVFLVSAAASYLTGVMLTVDGGMFKGTL